MKFNLLTDNGVWKRGNCKFYDGELCSYWSWEEEDTYWQNRVKKDEKWLLRASKCPEYCATYPAYEKKPS